MTIINLYPDVGFLERWEWKTDILTSYNGSEQRISLRERPRIVQNVSFSSMDQERRRAVFSMLMTNIQNVFTTPLWAYNSKLTQSSLSGTSRVYFNPAECPVIAGELLVLINPRSGDTQSYFIAAVYVDGCDITGVLSGTVDTDHLAVLGYKAIIEDKASMGIQSVTSDIKMSLPSWTEPTIVRSGSIVSLAIYDTFPVLEKTIIAGMKNIVSFKRRVIDYEIGLRNFSTGWNHAVIKESLSFKVSRVLNTDDLDYWRLFISTVKGAQKAFLLSTGMEDLTLSTPLIQNGGSVIINETSHVALFHVYESFKRIKISYSDGTFSYHTITASVDNGSDATLTITPLLPNDAKVSNIYSISYLLKGHMGDIVTWGHGHLDSELSMEFSTTDQG